MIIILINILVLCIIRIHVCSGITDKSTISPNGVDHLSPITILTFASRKRGVMQLPGYFGSLLNNTSSKRFNIYFNTDNEGYSLLNDCLPALRSRFYNVTIKNLNWPEFSQHLVITHYEKYFKNGVTNPHWRDNNYFQRYHVAI